MVVRVYKNCKDTLCWLAESVASAPRWVSENFSFAREDCVCARPSRAGRQLELHCASLRATWFVGRRVVQLTGPLMGTLSHRCLLQSFGLPLVFPAALDITGGRCAAPAKPRVPELTFAP